MLFGLLFMRGCSTGDENKISQNQYNMGPLSQNISTVSYVSTKTHWNLRLDIEAKLQLVKSVMLSVTVRICFMQHPWDAL